MKKGWICPNEDPSSLGSILVKTGAVSCLELQNALAVVQNSDGQLIGEVLVRTGVVSQDVIDAAVEQQKQMRKEPLPKAIGEAYAQHKKVQHGIGRFVDETQDAVARLKQQNGKQEKD